MIIKCPSDCEHDFEFPHSIITRIRTVGKIQVIYIFVVCRFCGHWITRQVRNCTCPYFCHDKLGGLIIAKTPLDAVN